jgi:hypothetical protein
MNHTGLPQASVINFSRDGEMVRMNDDADAKVYRQTRFCRTSPFQSQVLRY